MPPLPDDASVFTLQVPLPDGQKLEVPLPEGCKEGDGLRLLQRSDESWKVMRKRERFSFVAPPRDEIIFGRSSFSSFFIFFYFKVLK